MYKVIKSQKRRRLFLILLEIIIGIGVYAFVFYSDLILGEKIEYTWEILLGYIVLVFFFEIISTISVFNKFDIQTRKNHQNINFLLGADIAEGYRFSQLGMLYYDADLYNVERDFDVIIEGLTVESSADKLNKTASDKTTNVINAIMPFDIENAVKWNSNYLKGYTSEKRDTNVEQLKPLVENQSKDIAKFAANDTLKNYDRGVAWSQEQMTIKGQQWKAAYLPVWLYSYQQVEGGKKVLHYVAVNARTKEVMGSVPIHMPKLLGVSALVELLGIIAMFFVDLDISWLFLLSGIIYFIIMYSRYRNKAARHSHETETKRTMQNLIQKDELVKRRTGLKNPRIIFLDFLY